MHASTAAAASAATATRSAWCPPALGGRVEVVTTQTEQVLEAALKLSREQREELMVLLADTLEEDTLEEGTPEEIEAAWIDEAKRRIASLRSGETTPVAWEDVEKRLFGR